MVKHSDYAEIIKKHKVITLKRIAEIVSHELTIEESTLYKAGKGRSSESFAKQLFYFLSANNTRHSLDTISEFLTGIKSKSGHRMVSYAKKKIEEIIYKTEQKRIMDEKLAYNLILRCMNIIIEEGYGVSGKVTPVVLASYYDNVAQY